jgi:hypothetical protein
MYKDSRPHPRSQQPFFLHAQQILFHTRNSIFELLHHTGNNPTNSIPGRHLGHINMSIRQCINDNHLEVHRNVAPHLQKAVYRIRLEVHNLRAEEDGERDGKSENHVTFAMLLGNGESVRVDMAPNPTTHLGKMDVRYRDDIVSRKTLRLTYVNARGCEKYFDPDQSPTADERYPPSSVDQILSFLVASNMHRYRFLYIDAQPLGCRYWM